MHLANVSVVVVGWISFREAHFCGVCWVYFFLFVTMDRMPKPRIADLKVAAQESLCQGFLRLIAPDGHMLDPQQALEDARLQDGDTW